MNIHRDDSFSIAGTANGDGVWRVGSCELSLSRGRWRYAERHQVEIDENWKAATDRNPNFFNGPIHLVDQLAISTETLSGTLLRTDFKSCLYWRACGFPSAGVLDGFGSGLIVSSDGAILLGRQRAGNINSGLTYLPAGFIDGSDVAADGTIDIAESVAREIAEETGLGAEDLQRGKGFYVVRSGAQLSIAVPYRSPLTAGELLRRIERHIAASPNSELEAAVCVSRLSDIGDLSVPDYTRPLLEALLADR